MAEVVDTEVTKVKKPKTQMGPSTGRTLGKFLESSKKMDVTVYDKGVDGKPGLPRYGGLTIRQAISGKALPKSLRIIQENIPEIKISRNGLMVALDEIGIPRQRSVKKSKKAAATTGVPGTATTPPAGAITIDKVYELLVTIHNQNTKLAADYAWQQEKLDALLKVWDLKIPARGAAPALPGMEALVGSAQQQNH